jgi:hypothetical protein
MNKKNIFCEIQMHVQNKQYVFCPNLVKMLDRKALPILQPGHNSRLYIQEESFPLSDVIYLNISILLLPDWDFLVFEGKLNKIKNVLK